MIFLTFDSYLLVLFMDTFLFGTRHNVAKYHNIALCGVYITKELSVIS